jgi:hypothetical protein
MVKSKKRNIGIGKPIRTRTSKLYLYKKTLSPYTRKQYGGNKDAVLNQALENIQNKKDPISQDKDLANVDLFIDIDKNPLRKKEEIEKVLNGYKQKLENIKSSNWAIDENIKKIDNIIQSIRSKEAEAEAKAKKEEDKRLAKIAESEKKAKKEEAERKSKLEKAEAERKAKLEKAESERKAKLEKVEAERDKAERDKAERDKAERDKAERIAEAERIKAERDKAERDKAERIKAERDKAERIAEAERVKAERVEAERIKAERDKAERAEAERDKAERAEAERTEAERAEDKTQRVANIQAEATSTVKNTKIVTVNVPQFSNQSPILISSRETTQNSLFKTLTDNDIHLLLSFKLEESFNFVTSGYLNNYFKFYINPHDRYFLEKRKIHHIETIILVLVGILNDKSDGDYKIVLKGGKGLQMVLRNMNWENIPTDDIDLLILPSGEYNISDVKKIATELSELISILVNVFYPSTGGEGLSILPEAMSINPNIVKMSYIYSSRANPILDIDFKEDTEHYFSDENRMVTTMYLKNKKNSKTNLVYHHQTLDAFIKEKQAIIKKYSDCICPTDNETTTNVVPTPECAPLCPSKKFILEQKFQKYQGLIEYYETQTRKTSKKRLRRVKKTNKFV